jgi:threonine dehydrogenase-like Zn-dependent dehydrogenase
MPITTIGVRIHGVRDLRLEKFDLPDPKDDEILAEVVCDSICMSSHKAAEQGPAHKRVPKDVAQNPTIIGHEFAGRLLKVGRKWAKKFKPGQQFGIQPALNYKGSLDAPGYSFRYIGGDAQRILIPREVMEMDCLLPYEGDAFFKASLAEPMSCIIGAFRAQFHHAHPGEYDHVMGIKEGGNCALLAAAGPMGQGAIDFAIHGGRKPALLLVTDIDPARLRRCAQLSPPESAAKEGVKLVYLNPNELPDGPDALLDYVRELTGGAMMDDVFVFFPNARVIEQGDAMLGRDGCLNFFAGPQDKDFKASLNFYNVHYERHHIVGTSGGNTEDMRIALKLMGEGRLNPAGMITHVGGLDAVVQTTLDLPRIPGGKKLIYNHVRMPLTAIDEFGAKAAESPEPLKSILRELDRICKANGGLWCAEAEKFLLSREELRFDEL